VKDYLLQCLRSLQASVGDVRTQIIVVDNNSHDGSVAELQPMFPGVQWIALDENVGFGRANNVGLNEVTGRYVLYLNPDTIVGSDTLAVMCRYLDEHPRTGIAGCKVLNPDGSFQVACRRGLPTPWVSFCKLFGLQKLFPSSKLFAGYNLTYLPIDATYPVDALIGAFMTIPLHILYEDRDLIVLDKPAGLVVHPAPGNLDGTLVNALLAHAGDDLPGIGGEKRPGIVHRLDKDTSGVMVAAKSELAMRRLSESFAERDLERHYLALSWGLPEAMEGEVNTPIGRHPADRKRMAVVERGGKPAMTLYKVLRSWGTACALVSCRLMSGRTHQIRVHMAHIGHPLVGDPVYLRRTPAAARGLAPTVRDALLAFPRQALHAASLGFRHPISGQALHFESSPPADMAGLIKLLDGNTE
jgi:23S rRNA pseudouridine1911/1915/1917 synthase